MFVILCSLLETPAYSQDYFQQAVNYNIRVALDDKNHMLRGFETIEYTNNAPSALEVLHFHLWPNAYKNNRTTLAGEQLKREGKHYLFNIKSQRGYIDSLHFKVDGKTVDWEYHPDHIDICTLHLNKPLQSGETIRITTPFRVKIPLGVTSRMGHIAQSYKITQWYPKPAVYDHRGWHPMPYRHLGEFYSEFGHFDVSITLPENYVVAATGRLRDPKEKKWLKQKARDTKGKFSFDRDDMDFPVSSDQKKTVRYTIDSAHDFAWFADKRYHVMMDSVRLPQSGRQVTTWAFFTNVRAELWRKATHYINDAIKYYSGWYGDYAYSNCTAVLGAEGSSGNGMEYPTITAIGHTQQPRMLEQVIMHEVGHNWFYGMLGFNERRYPYLDEGINTFSEIRYMNTKYPRLKLYEMFGLDRTLAKFLGMDHMDYADQHEFIYLMRARRNLDQPTNTASAAFTPTNYAAISYSKTGLAFRHLRAYLGEEDFNQEMRDFFRKWKFRHPYPRNLEQSFNKPANQPLEWFFDDMLKTSGKVDYKMKSFRNGRLLIRNREEVPAPLVIAGYKNGEKIFSRWYEGFKNKKWLDVPQKEADRYIIDPGHEMLELYRHNNTIKTRGLLRKVEPLNFHFMGLINDPSLTGIHYMPSLAWNYYDKTMIGASLYDPLLPPGRFDYFLAPLYSTGKKQFSGTGEVTFHLFPGKTFRKLQLKASGKRFAYGLDHNQSYSQVQAEASVVLSQPGSSASRRDALRYSATYATEMEELLSSPQNDKYKLYHKLTLSHDNSRKSINPYSIAGHLEYGGSFAKAWLEANYQYSYYMNEGLSLRLFAGTFLYRENNLPPYYAYHLSGSSGFSDYTFDKTFLGRFEDPLDQNANQLLAQQFYPDQGGFALYSSLGITEDWMVTLNLTTPLPLIRDIPVEAYANFGTFGKMYPATIDIENRDWALETGIKFSFLQLVDIYFPVAASNNLERVSDYINTRYGEKIRFHIRFSLFQPSRITEQLNL